MKKIISLILSGVMLCLCIVPVLAGSDDDYNMGLIFDTWEGIINDEYEDTLMAFTVGRKGDVNFDGKVTAIDARICLQAIATGVADTSYHLPQGKAADVNNDRKISAVDARIMLQNVAGINEIVTYAEAKLNDGLNSGVIIGPLCSTGGTAYYWQYEIDKEGLNVLQRNFDLSEPEVIGGPVNQYFAFTPEAAGTYTITFKHTDVNQTRILDEFTCVLTVSE